MEKAVSGNVAGFVDRRLHPVRLSISHLNRLLEGSRQGSVVNVNRDLLLSITSTIELFIEDFESNSLPGSSSTDEKKGHDKITESPRVTQTRIS
jgi:hypothetical protein